MPTVALRVDVNTQTSKNDCPENQAHMSHPITQYPFLVVSVAGADQ